MKTKKQAVLFCAFCAALLATYFLRDLLGEAVVGFVLFFLSALGMAAIYYLELRSSNDKPVSDRTAKK